MSSSTPESELPRTQPEIVTPGVAISGTLIWLGVIVVIAVIVRIAWRILD